MKLLNSVRKYGALPIASAFGGAIAGLSGAKMFGGFAPGGIFGIPMFIGDKGIDIGFIGFIVSLVVAFVGALVLTLIFVPGVKSTTGYETKNSNNLKAKENVINSPISGEVKLLEQINDEVFSTGMMGKGVAIVPNEGKIIAPFNGEISSIFPTKHAIGLRSEDGIDMLIHVGMDTVNLKGKYFETDLKQGQRVNKGEVLEKFDISKIKEAGYDVTVPVIITNSNDFKEVEVIQHDDNIKAGDNILTIA